MVPQAFYQPVPRGLEIKISDRVAQLRAWAGDARAGARTEAKATKQADPADPAGSAEADPTQASD